MGTSHSRAVRYNTSCGYACSSNWNEVTSFIKRQKTSMYVPKILTDVNTQNILQGHESYDNFFSNCPLEDHLHRFGSPEFFDFVADNNFNVNFNLDRVMADSNFDIDLNQDRVSNQQEIGCDCEVSNDNFFLVSYGSQDILPPPPCFSQRSLNRPLPDHVSISSFDHDDYEQDLAPPPYSELPISQGCKCFLFFRISYFFNACAHSPFFKFKM